MKKNLLLLLSFVILISGGMSNNLFSQNLIVNGDFETGDLVPWNNSAKNGGDAVYTVNSTDPSEGSHAMSVQVNTLGGKAWDVQSQSNKFDAVIGKTYNVEFYAKSDIDGSVVKVVAQSPDGIGDYQFYNSTNITLNPEWTKYTWEFEADTTSSNVQFKFQYQAVDNYHIDSVAVWDPSATGNSSPNLLTNWGFEEALTSEGKIPGWNNMSSDPGVVTFSLETTGSPEGENHMKVNVENLGDNNWSIQSYSSYYEVIGDSTYKVTWWAKSSVDGAEMNMIFIDGDGQQYGGKKALTTDWAEYSNTWTARSSATAADAHFTIWWMNVAEYYVDSFFLADPTYDPGLEAQTIDFPAIDDKFTTDASFDITATASSGLPVTFTIEGPATLDGNTVTLTGDPGTVTIVATQEGNDTYSEAEVERSFVVTIEDWVYEQTLELDVKYALGTMTIDGIADEPEWSVVDAVAADTYYNDANNEPDYYTTDITAEDLRASFKVLWSESGIYVYADITDDVIHTDSLDIHTNGKAHQYDNLEVYIHVPEAEWTEDLKASDDYAMTTFQMRSSIDVGDYWSGRSPYATDGGGGWTSSALDNFYTYAFAHKEGGVTYEGFYPFDKLFGASSAALPSRLGDERSILFEIAYGDSDGEGVGGLRAGGIVWNSIPDILNSYSDVAANHRQQFGQINLTAEIAEGTSSDDFNVIENGVKVYPTLFSDHIRIQSENQIVDVKLYNLMGKEVLHIHNPGGIEKVNQLDALSSGVYFLKMKSGNKTTVAKLIKD